MKRKKKFDKKLMSITFPVNTHQLKTDRRATLELCEKDALILANRMSTTEVDVVELAREEEGALTPDTTNLVYLAWGTKPEDSDGNS